MKCECCGYEFDRGFEFDGRYFCFDCVEDDAIGMIEELLGGERCDSEPDEEGGVADAIRVDGKVYVIDEIKPIDFLKKYGLEIVYDEEDDGSDRYYEEYRERRRLA